MRISDWSSDVCSSDLHDVAIEEDRRILAHRGEHRRKPAADDEANRIGGKMGLERSVEIEAPAEIDIVDVGVDDRSEERRVGTEVSVRVDLGGRRRINKTINEYQTIM